MMLHEVHTDVHTLPSRKRVGRGIGTGNGKTSGRGHKGAGSRSGTKRRLSFEGGQMPLTRRIAKRGFSNGAFRSDAVVVTLGQIDAAKFEPGSVVSLETLAEKRVVSRSASRLKVIGNVTKLSKINLVANQVTRGAEAAIVAGGGKVTLV